MVRPGKHDRHTRNTTKTDTLSRPTSHAELNFSDIPNASTGDAIGSVPPGLGCVGIEPDIMPLSSSSCANADGFLDEAWRPTRLSSCAYLREVCVERRASENCARIARQNCAPYTAEAICGSTITRRYPKTLSTTNKAAAPQKTHIDSATGSPSFEAARSATESTPATPLPAWSACITPSPRRPPRPYSEFCATADESAETKTVSSVSGNATSVVSEPDTTSTSIAGTVSIMSAIARVGGTMRTSNEKAEPTASSSAETATSTDVEIAGKVNSIALLPYLNAK